MNEDKELLRRIWDKYNAHCADLDQLDWIAYQTESTGTRIGIGKLMGDKLVNTSDDTVEGITWMAPLKALVSLVQAVEISAELRQSELAKRVGVHFSQISRWEKSNYAGVSVERIQDVIDALGIKATHKVVLKGNHEPS